MVYDLDWQTDAACQSQPPEWFFPVGRSIKDELNIRRAKECCAECPVRQPCLQYAMSTHQYGIWGGTTEEERTDLRLGRFIR